jgi:hypothetical protein
MADLSVVPVRNGKMDMRGGFDIGAGPSVGVDDAVALLEDAAENGELDPVLVRRVAWMQNWEDILLGEQDVPGWARDSGDEVITAICDTDELASIIEATEKLAPKVELASWKELLAFLRSCAKKGGTIALYYDPCG